MICLGYLLFSPSASHLLFQLINRRYESKSTIITSNRSSGEWGLIFGDPTVATAILDRLLHHCVPVTIMGQIKVRADTKSRYPAHLQPQHTRLGSFKSSEFS